MTMSADAIGHAFGVRVQKVQKVQRVVVAASPQVLRGAMSFIMSPHALMDGEPFRCSLIGCPLGSVSFAFIG